MIELKRHLKVLDLPKIRMTSRMSLIVVRRLIALVQGRALGKILYKQILA
jgi:hypothetical protein